MNQLDAIASGVVEMRNDDHGSDVARFSDTKLGGTTIKDGIESGNDNHV